MAHRSARAQAEVCGAGNEGETVNALNVHGDSALHVAMDNPVRNTKLIELLQRSGADLDLNNSVTGVTPRMKALKNRPSLSAPGVEINARSLNVALSTGLGMRIVTFRKEMPEACKLEHDALNRFAALPDAADEVALRRVPLRLSATFVCSGIPMHSWGGSSGDVGVVFQLPQDRRVQHFYTGFKGEWISSDEEIGEIDPDQTDVLPEANTDEMRQFWQEKGAHWHREQGSPANRYQSMIDPAGVPACPNQALLHYWRRDICGFLVGTAPDTQNEDDDFGVDAKRVTQGSSEPREFACVLPATQSAGSDFRSRAHESM